MDVVWLLAIPVGLMVAVSVWGAATVPADKRFRMRFGGLGFETTVSKSTALVMWPGLGAIVGFGVALVGEETAALVWVGVSGLLILLVAQFAAVSAERDR